MLFSFLEGVKNMSKLFNALTIAGSDSSGEQEYRLI